MRMLSVMKKWIISACVVLFGLCCFGLVGLQTEKIDAKAETTTGVTMEWRGAYDSATTLDYMYINFAGFTTKDDYEGNANSDYVFQNIKINGVSIYDINANTDVKGKGAQRKETTVSFDIPAGVDTNSYIRKRGFGQAAPHGGTPGDLIVVFRVESHKIFVRDRFDLKIDLPISYKTAVLGGTVKVPTIDETFEFTIPEGTQSGTGNLIVRVIVEIPTKLSKEQKRNLESFDEDLELKQYDKMRRYSDNVGSLYGEKPYE